MTLIADMPKIGKILIANRGEIAIRIARTCRKMGIQTVGIFSETDRKSLHLEFCDEAHCLGEGGLADTYLNVPKIIGVLRRSGAQAVHPGYGFLSERAAFAVAVHEASAIFIGPSPESIRAMGDKIEAKRVMASLGVPLLPGSTGGVRDLSDASKAAVAIGYPVLLKASAGGGGKGMRIVREPGALREALESASREAAAYFGDGTIYVEKYLEKPHHIEVQILGDGHGGGGHVFDRECSIQRRHQKLVEESPAPLLMRHPKSREKILALASKVVAQARYASAGTLEFLGDDQGGFYFMETNTRLQVEHPVTEWVTGLDLVERQIRVAAGERLAAEPLAIATRGHSIEVRVYAETPFTHMPTGGRIRALRVPSGPFTRVDSAVYEGYDMPMDFDPTLMKVSTWGSSRPECVGRLRAAIDELRILGVQSNQGLFWAIAREPEFLAGEYGTPYLERNGQALRALFHGEMERLRPGVAIEAVESTRASVAVRGPGFMGGRSPWELLARRQQLRGEAVN